VEFSVYFEELSVYPNDIENLEEELKEMSQSDAVKLYKEASESIQSDIEDLRTEIGYLVDGMALVKKHYTENCDHSVLTNTTGLIPRSKCKKCGTEFEFHQLALEV
jgi:hypothetical protein